MIRTTEDQITTSGIVPKGTLLSLDPIKEKRMVENHRATYFESWERTAIIDWLYATFGSAEFEQHYRRFIEQERICCDDEEWELFQEILDNPSYEFLWSWCKYLNEQYSFKPRFGVSAKDCGDAVGGGTDSLSSSKQSL